MNLPTIIRTDPITAEEAAEVYGLPRSHVAKLQKLLIQSSKNRANKKRSVGSKTSSSHLRRKKRSAK